MNIRCKEGYLDRLIKILYQLVHVPESSWNFEGYDRLDKYSDTIKQY